MKLSTGLEKVAIEFSNGDVDYIYFNTTDYQFRDRLVNMEHQLTEKVKELADVEIIGNGEAVNPDEIEIVRKFDTIVRGELNEAFGSDVSTVVFKYTSPFAFHNKEMYVFTVLKYLIHVVTKAGEKARKESEKVMDKYIRDYT